MTPLQALKLNYDPAQETQAKLIHHLEFLFDHLGPVAKAKHISPASRATQAAEWGRWALHPQAFYTMEAITVRIIVPKPAAATMQIQASTDKKCAIEIGEEAIDPSLDPDSTFDLP